MQEAIEDAEDVRVCDEIERRIDSGTDNTYDHEEVWAELSEKRGVTCMNH
jgi:hypothetical protein